MELRRSNNIFRTGLILAVLTGVYLVGCSSDKGGPSSANQPPVVGLSSAPPEGSVSKYTIHLFWWGWDPDGEISHYEYVVTDNESGIFDPADTVGAWQPVFSNDSIFTFSADQLADSSSTNFVDLTALEYRRSHTFFVRSIDERGLRSAPVYRSFTARTLSPVVDINVPIAIGGVGLEPAPVPPISTFRWRAQDFVSNDREVQEPDSFRTILVATELFGQDWTRTLNYIRTNPNAPEWTDWQYYRGVGDTGKFWTTPLLDFKPYVFAIQVKDEAGAVNPVFDLKRNARRVNVSTRKTGPILTVTNKFLGSIVTSSPNSPITIVDLPTGVPMAFSWTADATGYGGTVSGYRYGWDITDLNDDRDWDVDFTPFLGTTNTGATTTARSPSRTFFFGSHTFHVEVVDNSGFKSRIGITINVIPFTMSRRLLLVDDWIEPTFNGGWGPSAGGVPNDEEHDEFWLDMLSDLESFNPDLDILRLGSGIQNSVPIEIFADYQNVIWSANGTHNGVQKSILATLVRFINPLQTQVTGKSSPNIVALFMAAGGHVLLAGDQIMTMVVNKEDFGNFPTVYPIIFRYELAGDQDGEYRDSDIGVKGVGDDSFAYNECCLNTMDIAYIQNPSSTRRPPTQSPPPGTGCPVNLLREHSAHNDGLRRAIAADLNFATLPLRKEVAGDPTRFYHESKVGLNTEVYNPMYFATKTACGNLSEILGAAKRTCMEPIFTLECLNTNSNIYGQTIAFWTNKFATRVPDVGGVAARSAVFGFHPVFFNPDSVQVAIDHILYDEWQLPRK